MKIMLMKSHGQITLPMAPGLGRDGKMFLDMKTISYLLMGPFLTLR